jgi:tetratricopeptide (TPR) repeat protein
MTNVVSENLENRYAAAIQQAASQLISGKYAEAESVCSEILQHEPQHFDALQLMGILQGQTGRLNEAEATLKSALRINPESAATNRNLANVYNLLKRDEDAVDHYKKAFVEDDPQEYLECVKSLTGVLGRMGRFEEVRQIGARAIELFPENPGFYNCVAGALTNLSRHDEALTFCKKAIELSPDFVEAYNNAAVALMELGRIEEALARCNTALAIRPDDPEINCTITAALIRLSRFEEALVHADRACSLRSGGAIAHSNAAVALSYLRKFPESIARFDQAIAAAPDDPDIQLSQGIVYLLMGDYEKGFVRHEARLLSKKLASTLALPKLTQPKLTSLDMLSGKSVLVYQEQGIGDAIHFLRYVPMLSKIASTVYYAPPQPLLNLVRDSFGNIVHVLYPTEQFPSFDYHCSVMSLAHLFRTTTKNIPASTAYLQADPQKVLEWKKRLFGLSGMKVGLVWAGNPRFKNDRMRSMQLQTLAPLLRQPGVSFISLQKECPLHDTDFLRSSNISHFGDELADFSDTAALIECMDLVIATDTSVPHLVGALGKPLWLLLGTHADWRWGLDGECCPWYPTARLFRKENINDWTDTIATATHALDRYRRRNWLQRLLSR